MTDPLVAIGIGLVWLNEDISSSPAAIAAELIGLVVMSAGVVALAYRSPHLDAATSAALARPRPRRRRPASSHPTAPCRLTDLLGAGYIV